MAKTVVLFKSITSVGAGLILGLITGIFTGVIIGLALAKFLGII